MKATFLEPDGDGLLVAVELGVYSIAAVMRVAYRFTDCCYLHLQQPTKNLVEVRFRAKVGSAPLADITGAFCNEILDQTLREIVARESEPVRNLVLAHALSRTPFLNPELEQGEPNDSWSQPAAPQK